MKSYDHYSITACWGPRLEKFEAVKSRVGNILARLSKIDGSIFVDWYQKPADTVSKVDYMHPSRFSEAIQNTKQDHENLGFRPFFRTSSGKCGPKTFSLGVSIGCAHDQYTALSTELAEGVDPAVLTFDVFRPALLAVAESLDAERAYAFPSALAAHWKPRLDANPAFPIAWISYVAPRAAHLVTPPPTAIVEHRPDGGLLMAATDEIFDVGSPAHMAVARDIEAAVAPLHGHPWLPEYTTA